MKDPYKVLNVDRDASAADIKQAYRRLAKQLHPDLNPGDQEVERRFKEASQAYAILGDTEKRSRYDRGEIDSEGKETPWRSGFRRGHSRAGADAAGGDPFGFAGGATAEEFFSDIFGARRSSGFVRRKGADIRYSVPIGFLEAVRGAKKRIKLGDGKTLEIGIPAGTEDHDKLRLKGQGEPGVGGATAGDALVEVSIEPHRFFTRNGENIHVELPVTLQEALLGATVPVPTIRGQVTMKIPPGSNSGSTLRLKGRGIKSAKTDVTGDQYVKLKLVLPDKPDKELSAFVESWGKANTYDPRRKAGMLESE